MKKFISIVSAMLLVFGFAASAFAIHAEIPSETQAAVAKGTTQITLGGAIRVRGEMQQNTADFNDDAADYKGYYDQRVRLRLQADVTKNTMGVIHLESGDSSTASDVTWGGVTTGENKGSFAYQEMGNSKQSSLYILEAWIQHKGSGLFGTPAGFKIGHQPVKLGYGLFFDHSKFGDDAINLFLDPTKEFHIEFVLNKLYEDTDKDLNNDGNMYSLILGYTPNKNTKLGFDVTYINVQNNLYGASISALQTDADLWNFGLRGETNINGLGIKADIELQSGKTKDNGTFAAPTADIKYRGYAYLVGLSYKLDPVKLSLDYAYGSGDDDATDKKNKTFQTILSGVQNYTYVYDYRSKTATGTAGTGLANTWYVKLGGNADITKDLNADLNIYYLRAVKKYSTTYDSKKIGTEVDAKLTYKIDKNLVYWVEGGYLFAGNLYKNFTTSATKNVDDAYAVRHGIELSF